MQSIRRNQLPAIAEKFGQLPFLGLIVHSYLQKQPITAAKKVTELCKVTLPTANKSLHHLEELGIVKEVTGKSRNKIYVYQKYLDILSEGAQPINEL